jgi:hypothetical protein
MIPPLLSFILSSMNMNGNIYGISNINYSDPILFSTEYSKINATSEFFDIYSPPITSRYAMVYWTMMKQVPLPDNIVKRFDNKNIAIVGYEVDQVFRYENGKEQSVPITWAYNHHYEAYLKNSDSAFEKVDDKYVPGNDKGQYNHGTRKLFILNSSFTNDVQFFSEANGGEFRASFHGYPNGYAQLLNSPKYFNIQPMQIDTRNRSPEYMNDPVFHPGILPVNSAAPEQAQYSGLLECPCTTRINKTIHYNYNYLIKNSCDSVISNVTECSMLSPNVSKQISSHDIPYGCSFKDGITYLNSYHSDIPCGSNEDYIGYLNDSVTRMTTSVYYNASEQLIHITMTGPSDVWYGVAFNATEMKDEPYSIIVDGTGNVFEQKLGNHGPGIRLNNTLTIINNDVINGTRTVHLNRKATGYYNFDKVYTDTNMLTAVGSGPIFAYHKLKTTNTLSIRSVAGYTCICNDGKIGKINGIRFQKNCMPEPRGDLIRQHNPSCFIETYQGGLSCCHHNWVLLDANQTQPEHEMTYYLKFRFWFQNYTNQRDLVRAYYETEAFSGEYDVPKCPEGIPPEECIHSITAHWQVKDMVDHKYIGKSSGFELIYAGPHCHAPMCIDIELYNSDTGNILCHVDGILGSGNANITFDEKDYLKLNPCLWGQDRGLLTPEFLKWDTNLTSIKRSNNTNAHYGDMASWQMRGVVVN